MFFIKWILSSLSIYVFMRLLMKVIVIYRSGKVSSSSRKTHRIMVILGSGGHTAEMLSLLQLLPKTIYTPRIYIVARTDAFSVRKVMDYEGTSTDYRIEYIPRSREVGQSYLTSLVTSGHAWLYSLRLLYLYGSHSVILCNGPGTGVPLCLTAVCLRRIGYVNLNIVFIESLARVHHLSLTGKLLYPFVDRFLVQWPYFKEHYPRSEYHGILV